MAANGCTNDGADDNSDSNGIEAMSRVGMGHGLRVKEGPSQINGVRVRVVADTGALAAAGGCTYGEDDIKGNRDDELGLCPRKPRRVDEGEHVKPT